MTVGAGAGLVVLAVVAGAGSRTTTLRQLVIDTLADRLDSEVTLESFSADIFPTVDVRGEGLVVRLRGHEQEPPLLQMRSFAIRGGLLGLLARPRKFRQITLTGLEINIPPGGPDFAQHYGRANERATAGTSSSSPIHIERLEAENVLLRLIPRNKAKSPREFPIARLHIRGVGVDHRMPYEAELTNPVPRGQIATEGHFGPWNRELPAATPLQGKYRFEDVDLSTVKGIGGTLASTGDFAGVLGRIVVKGETRSPDFRLDIGRNALPLTTTFEAIVDGTDGDTHLQSVTARLRRTTIEASGAIGGRPGVKGRTVQLHAKVPDGRIEDLLALSVKGPPMMTGRVSLHTDLLLPPGNADVIERLRLAGQFDLSSARFRSAAVQEKLGEMAARASGEPDDPPERLATEFEGVFRLDGGTMSFSRLRFRIPGASVHLDGRYGLRSEALHFDGTLRMDATLSEAAGGGMKSVFLKLVDPFFRRGRAGAVLPIKVRGTRDQPRFGLDVVKALTPKQP